MHNSEAHRLFEENSFTENSADVPLENKEKRLRLNIGAFNDGLRTSVSKE